jgi:hypothetical protein
MLPPANLDDLSHAELKNLVVALFKQVAELRPMIAAQAEEIGRLKGGPRRPNIKPSGMEKAPEPKPHKPAGEGGAALDWSYELLPEIERDLLRRLAVFPAAFTLEATTAVMGDTSNASIVAEGIANLVAKSLITLDGSSAVGRWRLLETIRTYALEKRARSGEAEQAAVDGGKQAMDALGVDG